jgi:hypothetical protein
LAKCYECYECISVKIFLHEKAQGCDQPTISATMQKWYSVSYPLAEAKRTIKSHGFNNSKVYKIGNIRRWRENSADGGKIAPMAKK